MYIDSYVYRFLKLMCLNTQYWNENFIGWNVLLNIGVSTPHVLM